LTAHLFGILQQPSRQWLGLDEMAILHAGEDIDIAGGGAANESKRQQGGTATNDEMVGSPTTGGEQFTKQSECLIETLVGDFQSK